ncbi:hypothetical protein COR50_10420 [Chitinophaga caeni]|uniref:Uncharacterized protein n=1 Tax=Chitinophaga caeni TaxID=2029983 RepID=A0A291QUD7_9BACT|nr:hypothetical protein [Chitinophaga caeni]ATL47547.1 hypothetical protein COR50_10420 [Chitinophaga caeni]
MAQIGHHGRQFDRAIELLYKCIGKLPFPINGAKFHGFLVGLNISSFAYFLDLVRNSSKFKAILAG